ncbi:MAG TPA: carboxymuconolactone decarboxylase family protein, partial [Acidimicrobiales bacterium]|nr:carboxymuconolactone decarboxylase family protein [Acidimicrobiales bacterium]
MANLEPLSRDEIPEFEPLLEMVEAVMGFVPNSMLTMARWPELLNSFAGLAAVVGGPGSVDRGLKHLVALMASRAAGCRYCQAHTSAGAVGAGVPERKVAELWEF